MTDATTSDFADRLRAVEMKTERMESFLGSEFKGPDSTRARNERYIAEKFRALNHAVFGNGSEGLKTTVTRLVVQVKMLSVGFGFAFGTTAGVIIERVLQ